LKIAENNAVLTISVIGGQKLMVKAYVGIDPGITGAIAVLDTYDGVDRASVSDVPTLYLKKTGKWDYNFYEMYKYLGGISSHYRVYLSLEQQQAMPQQGVSSTFQTGRGYGAWQALCQITTSEFEIVSPRKWKKALGLDSDKEKSRKLAIKLYPELEPILKLKKHHNRAEALLLAHYTKLVKIG
jgi:hypothetical protein